MNKQTNRQLGYSLAEVLVALAIFAVIFLAALTAYDRSNRVFRQGVESSNMQQNTRVAFDKVVADLRMAGYDFDRDGIPTISVGGTNAYQQPDEQFEYIGPAAITVRSNLDYETENLPCAGAVTDNCDNGREISLQSTQFPVVTTGNDEIVTYALVPASNETGPFPACDAATNCIQFYADTSKPRKSYPDTGGVDEKLVEIPGVDLCNGGCNNPPYTLYRFTLDPNETDFSGGDHIIRTPLASNIRSMQLTYYQDAQGTVNLKDLNNVTDESTGAAIRGLGQYKVSAPSALIAEREIRAKVNSVRLTLIGMNESRDAAYTDTAETLTAGPGFINQYRKYRLETLISPRNIQKRGMREQDTAGPGAPTGLVVCTGACGGVYMRWTAPAVGVGYGAPDQYKVIYDMASSPGYNCETTTYTNTFGPVFGTTPSCVLQGGVLYKFAVVALNSYGSNSSAPVTATPLNTTKYSPPEIIDATTTLNGQVTLTWKRPNTNASGSYSCPPDDPNPAELQGYIVEREDTDAAPGTWIQLPAGLPSGSVTTSSPTDTVTWTDTTAVNCVNYRYRVTAVEACAFNPTWNAGSDASIGHSDPSPAVAGRATSPVAPGAVPDLAVDPNSPCDGVSGTCNVNLAWQKVTKDTAGNPITIDTYIVSRQLVGSGTWADIDTVTGGALTYIDVNLPTSGGQTYLYHVRAHSRCPSGSGTDGAPSPDRPYPCTFGAGILGAPLILAPGAFDGDGSPANPFKIGSGTPAEAAINVLMPGSIARVVGRDYTAGGSLLWQNTLTAAPFSFSWDLGTGATEQFNVAVVDTGGCVNQSFAWFEDEAQNCCLTPTTFDPTVVTFSVPTTFVDFNLKSVCNQILNITGIDFTVDPTKTPSGEKLLKVAFPTSSGGCADASFAANCGTYTFSSGGIGLTGSTPINVSVPGATGPATIPSGILPVTSCSGCVADVTVTSGGTGYTSAPSVAFTGGGGSGAAGIAEVFGGSVTSVTLTSRGSGYTSTPTVSFSGGGGTGAAATALVGKPVKIRVYFGSKSLTSAGNQPVTAMTVNYTDATSPGGTSCQIK